MTILSSGVGQINPEGQLLLKLPADIILTGGRIDFFRYVFRAVHAVNRERDSSDFLGATLPGLNFEKEGLERLGNCIGLVGSESALSDFGGVPYLPRAVKASVSREKRLGFSPFEECDEGISLFRVRNDDWSPSRVRRYLERFDEMIESSSDKERKLMERRKKSLILDLQRKSRKKVSGFVPLKGFSLSFSAEGAKKSGVPMVSTYGLSVSQSPLVFKPFDMDKALMKETVEVVE